LGRLPRFAAVGAVAAALSAGPLPALETVYPAAGRAMPLNDAGLGARALALGSAFSGQADDGTALFWNPGGLAFLPRAELAFHHGNGLGGLSQDLFILGSPFPGWGTLSMAFGAVNNGGFEGRDEAGNLTVPYTAGTLGAGLGWAKAWTPRLGAGFTALFHQQTLDDRAYQAASAGAGLLLKALPNLQVGAAVANLGPAEGGQSPVSLNLGLAWRPAPGRPGTPLLLLAYKEEVGGTRLLGAGLEAVLLSALTLRGGYQQDLGDSGLDGLHGVSAGLGAKVAAFSLDYAYLPFGPLGAVQALSLSCHFGAPPAASAPDTEPGTGPRRLPPSTVKALSAQAGLLRAAILKDPLDAAAWWGLGNLYYQAGQFTFADTCYKRVLSLQPGNAVMTGWYTKFRRAHQELP
jgi:hypothetical protein